MSLKINELRISNSNIKEDVNAKSVSFFAKDEPHFFSEKLVSEVIKIGQERNNNSRVCLHPDTDSKMHEMLIYQTEKNFFPPKKQLTSEKSFFIIKGRIAICVFEETGQLKDFIILGDSSNIFCRIPPGVIHMDLTISEFSVHLEGVPGPYKKDDCIFPDWFDGINRKDFLSSIKAKLK